MTTKSLATLATEASDFFLEVKPANRAAYMVLSDEAPQWVRDMVRAAHGGLLPDDIRYGMIAEALSAVAEIGSDGSEDDAHEATMLVEAPIYTSELTAWLASNTSRYVYCDDVAEEFSLTSDTGMIERLQMGWHREFSKVAGSVVSSLAAKTEAED